MLYQREREREREREGGGGGGGNPKLKICLLKTSINEDGKYKLNLQAFCLYSILINSNITEMENELRRHVPNYTCI